jgi:hypothetical protein
MLVVVDQPNYIPWKGYFDLIHDADLFVFYTDVQYTVRDWRNRNKIVTPNGDKWLSVPVGNDIHRLICEVKINDSMWQKNHYDTIKFAYSKTKYFNKYKDFLEYCYLDKKWDNLCDLDCYMIKTIAHDFLGCKTEFEDSRNFVTHGEKHERMLNLLKNIKENQGENLTNKKLDYLSGPAAKDYIVAADYKASDIGLAWKNYEGYPVYNQCYNLSFNHFVSIFDLLFNTGEDAPYFIWGWREESGIKSYTWCN